MGLDVVPQVGPPGGEMENRIKERSPESGLNHWFDGLVGCAVGASILGAVMPGTQSPKSQTDRRPMALRALTQRSGRSG